MREMKNQWKWSYVIFIYESNEFENHVTFVIIHQHQFSLSIWINVWIFDVMFQKFQSDFIWDELWLEEHHIRVLRQFILIKLTDHYILSLNNDHEWKRKFFDCVNHFNDDQWFAIFKIDLIMLFNFDKNDNFLLFHTFWTKIAFVEIDDVSSFANIQNFENVFILQKSINYCFFVIDFKSYDW